MPPDVPVHLRARGVLRADFARAGRRTILQGSYQTGGLRLLAPRGQHGCEVVTINTGGGIAGGDRLNFRFEAQPEACVALASQSAERVYRAQGEPASVRVELDVARAASLFWLPQETILFEGAKLRRRIDAAVAPQSTLVLAEATVFGRAAMGEDVTNGTLHDRWRLRRGGVLVFAEDVRLDGNIAAVLDRSACGGGARALATIVMVAPDAEAHLEETRRILAVSTSVGAATTAGASAWNGVLLVRLAGAQFAALRRVLCALLPLLCDRPLPRVWQ